MGRDMGDIDYALFSLEKEVAQQKEDQESTEIMINVLFGLAFTAISSKEIIQLELVENGLQISAQGSLIFAVGASILAILAGGLAIYRIYRRYKRIGKLL